jgi:uncharacterized OB-fold protein
MSDPYGHRSVPSYRIVGSHLELLFAVCGKCGTHNFPATVYGCRRCGAPAEALAVESRHASGVLRNYVTVHAPVVRGLQPPYIVGEVEIAPGVIEEAILAVTDESQLQIGMALTGVAVPTVLSPDAAGQDPFICRFTLSGQEAGQ